jgi:hypothetical protein
MSEIQRTPLPAAKLRDDVEELLAERDLAGYGPAPTFGNRLFGLPFDFWSFLRARWGAPSDVSPNQPVNVSGLCPKSEYRNPKQSEKPKAESQKQ